MFGLFSPKRKRDDSSEREEESCSSQKDDKEFNTEEDYNEDEEEESQPQTKTVNSTKESFSFFSYFGFGSNKQNEEKEEEEDEVDEVDEGEIHDNEVRADKKVFCTLSQLPNNFAEEVLDLEMKIDSKTNFTQKDIDRLVYLYSQAMEFYEMNNKDKYTLFKERLQKLLVNPIVFSKMKSQDVQTRDRSFTDTTGKRQAGLIKIDKNAPKCALGPSKLSQTLMLKHNKEAANNK